MHARLGEVAVSQTTTDAPLLPVEQHDKEITASVIGGATLVGLVATFIGGRKSAESKK
jgi:hypothetical protein